MATSSNFLKLSLPGNGEFVDSWDEPMNDNSLKIDVFAESVEDELSAARFSLSSLAAFLGVGHNVDGTLKATAEVEDARSSSFYGDKNQSTDVAFSLDQRIEEGDLDDTVTISNKAALTEGSKIWLLQGEKISLNNLVQAALIHSGNDAAVAIAEHLGGDVPTFVEMM